MKFKMKIKMIKNPPFINFKTSIKLRIFFINLKQEEIEIIGNN